MVIGRFASLDYDQPGFEFADQLPGATAADGELFAVIGDIANWDDDCGGGRELGDSGQHGQASSKVIRSMLGKKVTW